MTGPEAKIERAFVAWCNSIDIQAPKLTSVMRGWPDRTVLIPGGRPAFIEFKAPGEKPSKHQLDWIEHLRHLGYSATWVDNLNDAKAYIEELLPARQLRDPGVCPRCGSPDATPAEFHPEWGTVLVCPFGHYRRVARGPEE